MPNKTKKLEFQMELFDYYDFIESLDDVDEVTNHALVMVDSLLLRDDISDSTKVKTGSAVIAHAVNFKMELLEKKAN